MIGSNHSGVANHEFSFGLPVRVLPSAFFIASIYVFSVASIGSLVLKCQENEAYGLSVRILVSVLLLQAV